MSTKDSLDVVVEISSHLERSYHPTMVSDPDGVPMARVIITLRTNTPLNRFLDDQSYDFVKQMANLTFMIKFYHNITSLN
jgi:hypothetical protein